MSGENLRSISCHTHSLSGSLIHVGGRQFKITTNDLIVVNKIPADIGSEIYLEKVPQLVADTMYNLLQESVEYLYIHRYYWLALKTSH